MLEALSHTQLKHLLRRSSIPWPHNLTLSRIVGRSLRRRDTTLIELDIGSQEFWWLGLLIPLSFQPANSILVLPRSDLRRFYQIELPKLKKIGLSLPCWESSTLPPDNQLWVVNYLQLNEILKAKKVLNRQLIFPKADSMPQLLRKAMTIQITPNDWQQLIRFDASSEISIVNFYEELTRRIFTSCVNQDSKMRIDSHLTSHLRNLLPGSDHFPGVWNDLFKIKSSLWVSWAEIDLKMLTWNWIFEPLEPFIVFKNVFNQNPSLFLARSEAKGLLLKELKLSNSSINVTAKIGNSMLDDPIPLFAPSNQPLPNTESFSSYLLDQSRKLILGQTGLTILLINDNKLCRKLAAQLAAEFGKRVVYQVTSPEINGVICASWSWWLESFHHLPAPNQIIVGLLPLPSLENPSVSARVEMLKREGRDWFRELLLPEALSIFPIAIDPLRTNHGRLAILDGRIRLRSWGKEFFTSIEPWMPLNRLLPP